MSKSATYNELLSRVRYQVSLARVIEASRKWGLAGSPNHEFAPLPNNAAHYCAHCGSGRLGWQHTR